jgi:uncharacterized protein YqgV (UPF0045/DUF77 family)
MEITMEISYYPLDNNYEIQVSEFIQQLSEYNNIQINIGVMSSLVIGEYNDVMSALKETMQPFLEKYPSVFRISLASACKKCENSNS